MMRPRCSGVEELDRRHGAGDDADERVHGVVVAVHGSEQLLHLGRRRFERRQLGGELVDRQHLGVAGLLVGGHGVVERAAGRRTTSSSAVAHSSASRNASLMPWAVIGSLV